MSESRYPLTYALTTFNKLPYLRITLGRLLANAVADEEIVVADGGSTDGTVEYLGELHRAGKIHQFISEKDAGEAHGINKAVLKARGEVIKILTDDDAFYYTGIQKCRDFMLRHPEVDFMGADHLALTSAGVARRSEGLGFPAWLEHPKPFAFCGLTVMLRRASIPLLGLFSTRCVGVDEEFSLRVTALGKRLNMAWYSGAVTLHITNASSNMHKFVRQLMAERRRHRAAYADYSSPASCLKNAWQQIKEAYWAARESSSVEQQSASFKFCDPADFAQTIATSEQALVGDNVKNPGNFFHRNSSGKASTR